MVTIYFPQLWTINAIFDWIDSRPDIYDENWFTDERDQYALTLD